jgi:hypothetical protein
MNELNQFYTDANSREDKMSEIIPLLASNLQFLEMILGDWMRAGFRNYACLLGHAHMESEQILGEIVPNFMAKVMRQAFCVSWQNGLSKTHPSDAPEIIKWLKETHPEIMTDVEAEHAADTAHTSSPAFHAWTESCIEKVLRASVDDTEN